jgi:hypothetical protein
MTRRGFHHFDQVFDLRFPNRPGNVPAMKSEGETRSTRQPPFSGLANA